jgi:protein SCO1/2
VLSRSVHPRKDTTIECGNARAVTGADCGRTEGGVSSDVSAGRCTGRVAWALVHISCIARLLVAALTVACAASLAQAQVGGAPGPAFELTDHNGKPFSSSVLAGRPYAIFFGFTHCPDVCPTTLLEMSNVLKLLGADADRLKVVFVTVDPERDTPELMRQYLAAFDARIIGLTGSEAQVAAVAKGWNAFHNRIPEGDGTYTIVHSAYVYLMDRANRLAGTMGFQESEDAQLAKLRALLDGSAVK